MRTPAAIASLCPVALLAAFLAQTAHLGWVPYAAGAVALASAILGHVRPRAALWLLVFGIALANNYAWRQPLEPFPPILPLWAGCLVGWLTRGARLGLGERFATPLRWPLALWLTAGTVSALLTALRYSEFYPFVGEYFPHVIVNTVGELSPAAVGRVWETLLVFWAGPTLYWATVRYGRSRRDALALAWALAAGLAIATAFGAYQSAGHLAVGNRDFFVEQGRVGATYVDPNSLGACLALTLPILVGLGALASNRWAWACAFASMGAGAFLLRQSGARSAFLGVPLAFVFAALLRAWAVRRFGERWPIPARKQVVWAILLLVVAPAVFVPLTQLALEQTGTPDGVIEKRLDASIERFRQGGLAEMLGLERLPLWQRALRVARAEPISGVGLGAYYTEVPNVLKWNAEAQYYWDSALSEYLHIAAEMGLAGLAFFLALLWAILREAWRGALAPDAEPSERTFRALLFGALAAMALMFLMTPYTRFIDVHFLFWLAAGLAVAPWRVRHNGPLNARKSMVQGALALALLAAFCASSAWEATHGLSLAARRAEFGWQRAEGFYHWEQAADGKRLCWTRRRAMAVLPCQGVDRVRLSLAVFHPDAADRPVQVEVRLDGERTALERFAAPGETRTLTLNLPRGKEKARLTIEVDRSFVPAEALKNNTDRRELGVVVGEIELLAPE